MEPKSDSLIITVAADANKDADPNNDIIVSTKAPDDEQVAASPKKKRNGGAMQILQVAVFMLRRRRRSAGKSKPNSLEGEALASTKGTWKRLVGSIRPLHLQSSSNPTPPPSTAPSERYEDVLPPPMSPAWTDDLSSEDGMTSRYASAVNLQELDRADEEDNANAIVAGVAGCEHNIDAKAEEFIAQFYQQMRLQRLDSIDRYNEI